MIKLSELKQALKNAGYEVTGMKRFEMEAIAESMGLIQDGLLIKNKPEEKPEDKPEEKPEDKPEEKPEEKPEDKPEDKPEEKPEEKPEDKPEEKPEDKPEDAFAEMKARISGAKIPNSKAVDGQPLIEKTTRKKKKGESSPESFNVTGYVLIMAIDLVFPYSLAFINNMFDKKTKINATELTLTSEQTKKLEPLADQAADYLTINMNPLTGFLLVSTLMYGTNLMALRQFKESEVKK